MLQFWFPKEEFHIHLQPMMGYSEFCRNAILKEIELVNSDQYINGKIDYHQNKIKEWKERKKVSREDPEEVKRILELALTQYNIRMNSLSPDLEGFKFWCRSSILPKLKKAHCTRFEINDIVEMCSKGVIEV